MSGSGGTHPDERPQMRYLCEACQLEIAIQNDLQQTDLVTAFENLGPTD